MSFGIVFVFADPSGWIAASINFACGYPAMGDTPKVSNGASTARSTSFFVAGGYQSFCFNLF